MNLMGITAECVGDSATRKEIFVAEFPTDCCKTTDFFGITP